MDEIPNPGELKNMIKSALAFSNPDNEFDYLKNLLKYSLKGSEITLDKLYNAGFTVREIEVLTGVSKSQVARELKGK